MEIKRINDGTLWFREDEKPGWFRLTDSGLNPGEILDKLVKDEMNEYKGLCFSEALTEVQKKYPEIAKWYLEQLRVKN